MIRIDKSPTIIASMFDRIASTYDLLNFTLSFSMDERWRKTIISSLNIKDGDNVLDIATGTGDMAARTLRTAGCMVTGLDISRRMLDIAAKKNKKSRGRFLITAGDALAMPFSNETFDHAMTAFGIRNMSNLPTFLDEVFRVLKDGGKMAVLELSVPSHLSWKWVYLAYFKTILPVIGGLVSGDFKAYRYLRDSVMGFPPPAELERLMKESGFEVVQSSSLLLGIAHIYLLRKVAAEG
ncbi:MAG: bifunctional demethylmenaquinone methyltransferase/2-methoxy-6-polyprenyl-1,4-benzoquinol methylase UbiE [Syntrophobacterales bacterium]|nr:bifunctional demethylmenaquinone methyltransferase/2-methoxy-6-polyprenyl-1,4-benzoquinol methylase UbiE [Syntrophobacterales bacterium]